MLDVSHLEVVYHSVVRVLHGVSLKVPKGQIVALLGPNGAGKTTTFNMVVGLVRPDEGGVLFLGDEISLLKIALKFRKCYLPFQFTICALKQKTSSSK